MAIDLRKVKVNVPKVRMQDYFFTISGAPKTGKTTLFTELVKKYGGGVDKGLLLAFEPGYSALEVMAVDISDWYDFEDVVDQLLEHKDPHGEKLPYDIQWLCIDTVDMMWKMAEQHVLMLYNSTSSKKVRHVNHIGYGQGQVEVADLVHKTITKLMRAGYGIMAITHSKERRVEPRNGEPYDQLQLSLSNRAREIFVDLADFIVFLTMEPEKDENGNVQLKRYMNFRSDGYIEAGSRFPNVPEKIPYSIDGFVKVFEEAVKSSLKDGMSVEDLRKEQMKKREEKAKEYAKMARTKPEEIIGEIDKKIEELNQKGEVAKIQKFAETLKQKYETSAYKQFKDVDQLQHVVKILDAIINGQQ